MTKIKITVERHMKGFVAGDHEKILSCSTDDIEWVVPGFFRLTGKQVFDKEIENEVFVGYPDISIVRMVEESDIVVAEGTVQTKKKDGRLLDAVFCDVFHMMDGSEMSVKFK